MGILDRLAGAGKGGGSGNKEQDAQQKAFEQAKQKADQLLQRLRGAGSFGNPNEAERSAKALMELIKNPKLPRDWVREMAEQAKKLEIDANLKAADLALDKAMEHALADRKELRGKEVNGARNYLRKAASLGAAKEVLAIGEKKITNLMMSGGIKQDGPTKAKPLDTAPKPPNMAKAPIES